MPFAPRSLRGTNPFYVLLTLAGVAFVITACLYGVMTVQMLDPSRAQAAAADQKSLIAVVDRHGVTALLIELGVLATSSALAMTTDGFWTRRGRGKESEPSA